MCTNTKKLIFCSCQESAGADKASPTGEYRWTLDRYIGPRQTRILGKMLLPGDIDEQVRIEAVIQQMNSRNCFDFAYVPQEEDTFHISNGLTYPGLKYFSLIYRGGKWSAGSNSWVALTECIAEGIVKEMDEKD